MEQLEIQNN